MEQVWKYADMLDMPRPVSRHRPMPRAERAVQFAPFAALTGYEEAIGETARETDPRIHQSADGRSAVNAKLSYIQAHMGEQRPLTVTVSYFCPDKRKQGGSYEAVCGEVEEVDVFGQCLILHVDDGADGDADKGDEQTVRSAVPKKQTDIERFNEHMERPGRRVIPFGDILDLYGDDVPSGDAE